MNQLFLERKGVNDISFRPLPESVDPPPHRRRAHPRHIPGHHQQLRFVCLQLLGRRARFRPPRESSLGKTLLRKPIPLTVIAEESNRRSSPAPEDKNTTCHWVFTELALADPNQGIYPLRPSTGSIATRTRICAVIWIIAPIPARHETDTSNPASSCPSTECASCFRAWTRTRSRTPPSSPDEKRSVPQTPASSPSWPVWKSPPRPSWEQPQQLRPDASSIAYSPAATDEQPNTNRVAGQAPPQTAIANPEAASDTDGYPGTAPVGVGVARLARGWVLRSFSCSISADLAG